MGSSLSSLQATRSSLTHSRPHAILTQLLGHQTSILNKPWILMREVLIIYIYI